MEIIKYHNFKEFVVCGLRNGKILGVDIANKRIEFVKTKKNDTGKDNEMNVKDGKLTFYGENISYFVPVFLSLFVLRVRVRILNIVQIGAKVVNNYT